MRACFCCADQDTGTAHLHNPWTKMPCLISLWIDQIDVTAIGRCQLVRSIGATGLNQTRVTLLLAAYRPRQTDRFANEALPSCQAAERRNCRADS